MNYFEKIEAYRNGTLSEVEHLVFEEALAQSLKLQEEIAAYDFAHSLFDFAGETLSDEAILEPEASHTADLLINFAANNLSEIEILDQPSPAKNTATIRKIQPATNRTAWLVAASMLLILSLIGTQFYTSPSAINGLDTAIVANEPIETVIAEPINPVTTTSPKASVSKVKSIVTKPNYPPKKEKKKKIIVPKIIVKVAAIPQEKVINASKTPINKPSMHKLSAEEITTQKVISLGESVVYEGNHSVTLEAGFHAKAGASFVATSDNNANLLANKVIDSNTPTVYKASNTITLKPGFHVKSGADFAAKTESTKELSTDVVISDKEAVVFKAENTITFKPGFHAKAGATMAAIVGK